MRLILTAVPLFMASGCSSQAAETPVAPPASERAGGAAPSDFMMAAEVRGQSERRQEFVGPGETLQNWSRRVTVQRFGGASPTIDPLAFVRLGMEDLPRICPGATIGQVSETRISGRPAARVQAHCPRAPFGGGPESFVMLAFSGDSYMHAVSIAFRPSARDHDLAWAWEHLSNVTLCKDRETAGACRSS